VQTAEIQVIHRLASRPALILLLLFAAAAGGCAGLPAQEMSNARQALRAATNAGADKAAPELMAEARGLLDQAKTSLDARDYRAAREHAEQARSKAVEARHLAEDAKAPPKSERP
jgi:hypothetical protein